MSDLTTELNLKTAVDNDDTADYLTLDLAESLRTVDGQFSSTSGHAHNGSHQGGALQFLDLLVGEDLTVVGSSTLQGAVIAQQSLVVQGNSSLATVSSSGLATLSSLDVTTTSRLRGAVTIDGAINSSGTLTIGQDLSVGRDLTVTRNASVTGVLTVGSINGTAGLTITGNAGISGLLTAGRIAAGGVDYGPGTTLSVVSAIAQTAFYQRGSTSYRCWDNADFTFGVPAAASTLVQRDASGYITASYINYVGDDQTAATRPTYVLGRTAADKLLRWWPANAIGPPAVARFLQANLTLPALSSGGGTANATVTATSNSLGASIAGGVITVPYAGWYSISGGFNGSNNTGNAETMATTLISSAHGNLDSLGVPIKVSSFFGGYFSAEVFLNAGETIRLQFQTAFDAISGSGEILISFVPIADYPN